MIGSFGPRWKAGGGGDEEEQEQDEKEVVVEKENEGKEDKGEVDGD